MDIKIPGLSGISGQAPKRVVPKFAPSKDEDDFDHPSSARGGGSGHGSRVGSAHKPIPPINVDDMVVGGAGKAEDLEYAGYDHKYGDDHQDEGVDELPIMERPIKLKAVVDYSIAGDEEAYLANTNAAVEKFPPGQHPLEGVPNFIELPTPEAIVGKSR